MLQAQLALMEVHWPEGLMEAESSSHGASRSSKSVRRTKRECLALHVLHWGQCIRLGRCQRCMFQVTHRLVGFISFDGGWLMAG